MKKHDAKLPASLSRGDTLAIHVALLNAGVSPIEISWGDNLLVLEAEIYRRRTSTMPMTFPPVGSWGKLEHWEFPNPHSVYQAVTNYGKLNPGASKSVEYRVPFDSIGTYSIRVCGNLSTPGRICGPRDISVIVK